MWRDLQQAYDAFQGLVSSLTNGVNDMLQAAQGQGAFRIPDMLAGNDGNPRDSDDSFTGTPNLFTGIALLFPGVTIGGVSYFLIGMNGGLLQAGISTTGRIYAGVGSVLADFFGIRITTFGVLLELVNNVSGLIQRGVLELLPNLGTAFLTYGNSDSKTITDYNFDSGAFGSGWNISAGAPTFSTSNPISGSTHSMFFNGIGTRITSDFVTAFNSGYQCIVDFWILDQSSNAIVFTLEYFTGGGVSLGPIAIAMDLEGSGLSRRFILLFPGVAPISTAQAKLSIFQGGGGGHLYFQSINLSQGQGLMIQNGNIIGVPTFIDNTLFNKNINATGTIIASNYNPGANVATFLATPSSANLAVALTDETGTGSAVFATSPTLVTPDFSGSPTGTILGGTWTPTLTNVTNLTASTAYKGQYQRIGNVLSGSVWFDADPTAGGGAATKLGISLPVTSNFSVAQNCVGSGTSYFNAGTPELLSVTADAVNDRINVEWNAVITANHGCLITFCCEII